MITRRASEIMRLALTMSQIQNTDALSWRDKTDMLNQSYVRLYDDLNNSGDLYYSKELIFETTPADWVSNTLKIKLPFDFWKLLLVGYRSIRGEIVPIERSPNAGQYFAGYRIVNNELVFNNYFTPGPLVVRYIPQPQTITFPRTVGYNLPGRFTQAAYDSINDVVVLSDVNGFTILNNSSGRTLTQPMGGVDFALAISNEIIYVVTRTQIQCFGYNSGDDGLPERLGASSFGNFDIFIHSIGWEEGVIVANPPISTGMPRQYQRFILNTPGGSFQPSLNYWNFWDGKIIVNEFQRPGFPLPPTDRTVIYSVDGEADQDITEIFEDSDSFVIADPYIYVNKSGSVKVYDRFIPMDIAPAQIGRGSRKGIVLAAEANNETGLGVVFSDFHSGLSLMGFAADTVLNYPQNLFFDWLIADLAVKFRIALDIPTGELPALLEDYHDTLMKSISRDVYQMPRISNVYGRAYL